jgi:hypothetical protein
MEISQNDFILAGFYSEMDVFDGSMGLRSFKPWILLVVITLLRYKDLRILARMDGLSGASLDSGNTSKARVLETFDMVYTPSEMLRS